MFKDALSGSVAGAMSDQRQTRCPHCGSLFRVREAQLQAKNGIVRCGSCLEMFRADLNLVGAPAGERSAPLQAPGKKASRDESWAENLLADHAATTESEGLRVSAKLKPIDDHQTYGEMKAEDWSRGPASNNTRISLGLSELSDFMLDESAANLPTEPFHDSMAHAVDSTNSNADEAWAQAMLQQIAEAEKKSAQDQTMRIVEHSPTPGAPQPLVASSEKPAPSFTFGDEKALDFLNDEDLEIHEGGLPDHNDLPIDTPPLPSLHDPVTLASPQHRWAWERYLFWGGLQLLALLALAVQLLYFHHDALDAYPELQNQFQGLCSRLHCRHVASDLRGLRIDHLVVRPDTTRGVLLIDTLLHNDQEHDRPFPYLRLTLRDNDGNILGTRRLAPQDYIAGSETPALAAQTPVHVSLEVGLPAGHIPASTSLTLQAEDQPEHH